MKITNSMQKVACDILNDIEVAMMSNKEIPIWVDQLYDKVFHQYGLCRDPFVGMACTSKEYADNSLEYNRQVMCEKYGHCDGLE